MSNVEGAAPQKERAMADNLPLEAVHVRAAASAVLRQLGEAHPREEIDLEAVGMLARHALAARQQAKAFEAYFAESRRSRGPSKRPTFERREDGTYKDDHTQRHWWTWQQAQAQVPDGWVLVPVEPTPEMVRAADNYAFVTKQRPKGMWWWGRVYEAMLAASPKAAQPEPSIDRAINRALHRSVTFLDQPEQCRTDGRCQYAIDHGAEGLGHCPPGKCVQSEQAQQSERERFEALARREGYSVTKVRGGYALDGAPVYEEPSTHSAWLAWQAACASILARLEAVPVPATAILDGSRHLWVSQKQFDSYRAAMLAAAGGGQATAVGATSSLDPDEGDAVTLWAEIHRLRAAVQGPDGYASWQDAATAERMRRVAGVKVMRQALEALETCMGVPHWPSLTPTVAALRAAISQPPVQGSGS